MPPGKPQLSQKTQMRLYAFACDERFSVTFLSMWKPGNVLEKGETHEVLTMLDGMPSFAAGAFLGKPITVEVLADIAFSQFCCVFGLPQTTASYVASPQKSSRIWPSSMWMWLVTRENHEAVCNGRLHRHLNRVQQINTADTGSFFQWKQEGITFALYGWNAGPIDRTSIPALVGAKQCQRFLGQQCC
jgi:hypothetical protein